MTDLERFENNIHRITESGCWIWMGGSTSGGRYGFFSSRYKAGSAHKAALRLYKGLDVPSTTSVCHSCDVGFCVNPEHLFLGTHTDNMRDMVRKGRHKSGRQKLSKNDLELAKLFRRNGLQVKKIAEYFEVDRGHMSKLLTGCLPKGSRPK